MNQNRYSEQNDAREIYSVSEINHQLKQIIGDNLPLVWIEGEISNLARPASGHIYFSLKDSSAQIRCVMFRSSVQKVSFEISNGVQIIVRARASLYEPRGDVQLIADEIEEAGFGALQRQFEALKKKLHSEGLFDEANKLTIPSFPQEVAIVTSPSGAAIKDYLKVVQRRFPIISKSLFSVPVQGKQAASQINSAIQAVNRIGHADIIVLIRGGGSIEDLWAFNDEQLARTIAASRIPVVTGIGHEIDFTIADFVADLRAATPSIAAELTTPDIEILQSNLSVFRRTLTRLAGSHIEDKSQQLDWQVQRLQRIHPAEKILAQRKSLSQLISRLQLALTTNLSSHENRAKLVSARLNGNSPIHLTNQARAEVIYQLGRLRSAFHQNLGMKQHKLQLLAATMNAISPLGTLERGYSITVKKKGDTKNIIHRSDQTNTGDQLITYLAKGYIISRVESISSETDLVKIDLPHLDTN